MLNQSWCEIYVSINAAFFFFSFSRFFFLHTFKKKKIFESVLSCTSLFNNDAILETNLFESNRAFIAKLPALYLSIYLYLNYICGLSNFLRQKASEPLNQIISNFLGYLIFSGKMHIYKRKCEVSVVFFLFEILLFPHLNTLYRPTNAIVKLFKAKRKSIMHGILNDDSHTFRCLNPYDLWPKHSWWTDPSERLMLFKISKESRSR